MPHTRAARLRAMKEAADAGSLPQIHDGGANIGWNDYLDWDMPGLTYQPDALVWYPSEGATTDQPLYFDGVPSDTTNTVNGLPEANRGEPRNADFCGLQPWYSTGTRDLSSIAPAATTRSPMSGSEYTSYDTTPLDEGNQPARQSYGTQPWPHKYSRQTSRLSDGVHSQRASGAPAADLAEELEELDDAPSPSSEEENERASTAKLDASKKRKMAHSVIEKNYRSRIKDGMAELRHCVPTTGKGRLSLDSQRPGVQRAADDSAQNHSSGKVATLSDAVQYVKSLELQNEDLHKQLDVMHRRNHTLQKIALSKVDTNNGATTTISVEEIDQQCADGQREGGKNTHPRRSKKTTPDRARSEESDSRVTVCDSPRTRQKDDVRTKAVAHAPSLSKRYSSVKKSVTGKLAAIRISED